MPSTNAYDGKNEKSSLLTTSSGTTAGGKVDAGMTARVLSLLKSKKNTVLAMLSVAVGLMIFGAAILKNTGSPLRTNEVPMFEESDPKTYCEKATGEFGGYDSRDEIDRNKPFQLCFRAYKLGEGDWHALEPEQNCWSKSYYSEKDGKFEACLPQGYWSAVEKREASKCGLPCGTFEPISPKPCCSVASGTFGESSQVFARGGMSNNPFEACFRAYIQDELFSHPVDPPQYCWTKSYYNDDKYRLCTPPGYWKGNWSWITNPPAGGCGDPCHKLSNHNQPVC